MISYRKLAMRVLGHSPVSAVKTARRSTGKRAAALALTAALVVGMTLPAFADVYDLTKGDISVGFKNNQQTVTQEDGKGGYVKNKNNEDIIDLPDNDVVITTKDAETSEVKTTDNTVTVNSNEGKTVNVTLDNVTINVDEGYQHGYDPNAYKTAVSVTGSGNTNIELNGNNTLTSGYGHAGLEHNKTDDSGTLTITDDKGAAGSLTANGGYGAAGIGGSDKQDGQVTITGGEITANGGSQGAGSGGAGIGGGAGNKQAVGGDGDVTISGGTINATGGNQAAGIGGGAYGNGTVTITDGDITAKATGDYGAGIGGGSGAIQKGTLIGGNGTVTISGGTITEASGGDEGAGIGGGSSGNGTVTISGGTITEASGGYEGAGIGGGSSGLGNVSIEGNVTIENAQGGAGAAGIGGGAETEPDTEDTRNKISIKSTEAGSPNITAAGGGVLNNEDAPLAGAAAIGSGSVADGATEVKSDITMEGKVTINATGGGDVAIGDSTNGETQFSGLQVGTTITRRNAKGDDVSQPGDVPEPEKPEPEKPEPEKPEQPAEPEKPAQPTVTPTETEAAEAPSTGSVEVERPVTVEGLSVTNVLGKQITHTCTQNGTTLTIRANGIVTSAHLTLGMVRTLKAQGVKTLVFTTLLSRSTTVSVDALLAAEPDAPDETAVVWTHTGPRAALTINGTDHSALLK